MLKRNYYVYPAVLDYSDENKVKIRFPDFEEEIKECAVYIENPKGDDEIYEVAEITLFDFIHGRQFNEEDLPEPSAIKDFKLEENQRTTLVVVPYFEWSHGDGVYIYRECD